MPRNLSIDRRRPPTSPRPAVAGAAAPPGEVGIIIGRPIGRAPSSPRIPDQQFLQKEVAAAVPLKRNCRSATQAARPDRAGKSQPRARGISDKKVNAGPKIADLSNAAAQVAVAGRAGQSRQPRTPGIGETMGAAGGVSVPRNLSIDRRRPPTSPRPAVAGAAAPPGEVGIIIGRPIGRAPSSPRIPDQQFLQKEVAAAVPLKRNCRSAAQAARPDRAGQSQPRARGISDKKVNAGPKIADLSNAAAQVAVAGRAGQSRQPRTPGIGETMGAAGECQCRGICRSIGEDPLPRRARPSPAPPPARRSRHHHRSPDRPSSIVTSNPRPTISPEVAAAFPLKRNCRSAAQAARPDRAGQSQPRARGISDKKVNASALLAAVGQGRQFKKARDLAAWLDLVPRQHSTGGKPTLLGISKRGNGYVRRPLIHGARSCVLHLDRQGIASAFGSIACKGGCTSIRLSWLCEQNRPNRGVS